MPRHDPAQAFKAQGIPDHAVGTVDELIAKKMPTKMFHSCAEPAADGSVAGCPLWYDCAMSYKGLPAEEGGGPRNHCWERIKSDGNGGGVVRNVHPCYWGVAQQDVATRNEEILQVIADEGETFEQLTTVPDPTGGKDNMGFFKWDPKLLMLKVPAFKRVGEEQKLAVHELRGKIIQREQERLQNERPRKALGIQGGQTPLDKRGRRGGEGKTTEG